MSLVLSAIPELDWPELTLRLAAAAVCGGALGIERELRDHEAGFRTHLLVALGSAIFTVVSAYGFEAFLHSGDAVVRADPTRIAAQIVTGIGFLGAGAIIRDGMNVRGLTTAANLWAVAGIGICCGAGYYSAAAIGTAIALIALWPLRILADMTIDRFRHESTRVTLQVEPSAIDKVLDTIARRGHRIQRFDIEHEGEHRRLIFNLDRVYPALIGELAEIGGVKDVGWER
ncbi:MAG TPA: MgtC/SapB family protein [Gaiellaceae bacterium]|nr:MgtC/SapB family protein [Gaiellaceae bacterium]